MEIGVAHSSALVRPGRGPAVDPVAAAEGDAAELLHVDVDQFARSGPLVAADRCRCLAVQVGEATEVVAAQDPVDRRWRHVEVDGKAVGSHFLGAALATDLGLHVLRGPTGRAPRTTGAVMEAIGAELEVAVPPLGRALPRDAHGVSDMGIGVPAAMRWQSSSPPWGVRGALR